MAKARVREKKPIQAVLYLVQNAEWNALPDITHDMIIKRINDTFSNLLKIKIVNEASLPKAINLVDSISYVWNRDTNKINEVFKRQVETARSKTRHIPPIEIASDRPLGTEKGSSLMYKERCQDKNGNPARVSMAIGCIFTNSIIDYFEKPAIGFPSEELKNKSEDHQRNYGILFGNFLSHEIRHEYMGDSHSNDGGLGADGSKIQTDAVKENFTYSAGDLEAIGKKIKSYKQMDQEIAISIETR